MRFFVGIGAQKAGSTWLHHQLTLHPEVALPTRKEVHYFDAMFPTRSGATFGRKLARNLESAVAKGDLDRSADLARLFRVLFEGPEAYRAYLELTVTEQTTVVGEITPGYADLAREGFAAMKATLDPLVVFVMRDPFERYWSAIRMRGWLSPERRQRMFETQVHHPVVWGRSDYQAVLELLDEVFEPDQVYVTFYEHMFSETALSSIADFLGVQPVWPWDLELRLKEGAHQQMPEPSDSLVETFLPVYKYVRERFGADVPETWRF